VPLLITTVIYAAVALYYVVSSWKTLKGAQWSIVAGVVVTLLWVAAWVISQFVGQIPLTISFGVFAGTCIFLSFPLSLLVYVSIRFREIIGEVRQNAQQVMQVTEEKRQQALNQQKILEQEVKKQTADLTETLQNLKSTQSQLIQSEKMASLGELTAGIAHEIQNPLNFVNNFSEVNKELLEELKDEVDKGNIDEVKAIATDVIENEKKINHHGKRADAIVKGMLQHSRASAGQTEPTDINALVDEYFRLAYHGLRARDNLFNATLKTDYDESIASINIIPQDIGRVILNLITNAFYAVTEKKKQLQDGYEPIVSVSTKKIRDKIEVRVKDNGNGIPQKVLDKIFQPFFTTKPTGQGTGLGLSLSYDIIKAHGGEIKVETKDGEGSKFVIQITKT
jgi:signal transduction histidine kinase